MLGLYGVESQMVAIVKSLSPRPERRPEPKPRASGLAKLKSLHAEAEETAHLANLLGRSGYAGIALPFLAVVTMGLSVEMNPAAQMVWLVFVGAIAGAMLFSYRRAMARPFERPVLKEFAKDLSAILLFAGFAWGSGAFLALPAATPAAAAIAFAVLPAAIVAYLLRDRTALFLFLAPVTALTVAACLLKPFAGGWIAAVAVLVLSGAVAAAAYWYQRLTGVPGRPAMLSLP
jgi:divalent metal cation (Fe/Co/Zn/Cd) transporter